MSLCKLAPKTYVITCFANLKIGCLSDIYYDGICVTSNDTHQLNQDRLDLFF